jgi:hypothetical protein
MTTARFPASRTASALLVSLLLASGAAFADVGGAMSPDESVPVGHVSRTTLGGLAYQNGGVGQEEVADMDSHREGYTARVTFSVGNADVYAADLKLRVTTARGAPVFSLDDAGPITDMSLPPGTYKVSAWYGDTLRTGTLQVGRNGRAQVNLHWNNEHPTDITPDTPE